MEKRRYEGPFSKENGSVVGSDLLGRKINIGKEYNKEKQVGLFYFMWMGQHGRDKIYDNSILGKIPGATLSGENWIKAGGGQEGETHFWGKPVFDYYTTDDVWVIDRQIRMFIEADVDYLVFDVTNCSLYINQTLSVFDLLLKHQNDGEKVPHVAFYTNTAAGRTANNVYKEYYVNHPEYESIWYKKNGKPLLITRLDDPDLLPEVKDFFYLMESQWPNEEKNEGGFPWMEFWRLLSKDAIFEKDGEKLVNVSVAQHDNTCTMSATAFYGQNDRTRSWHNGANDKAEDALLYGYNFEEQWNWAIKENVDNVFVTGWNEWGAQRQSEKLNPDFPVYFVDCCDENTSRDVEPSDGVMKDNYYMQLIQNIRRFKGSSPRVDIGGYTKVTLNEDSFDKTGAVYTGTGIYNDNRNCEGFGKRILTTDSVLNKFKSVSVIRDKDYLGFEIQTVKFIKQFNAENRMMLLIKTDIDSPEYNFIINRAKTVCGKLTIENGKNETIGFAEFDIEGNKMFIKVPRDILGIPGMENEKDDLVSFSFKLADGCDYNDGMNFYKEGDCLPYGRPDAYYGNIID